jgi:hypothetical protein
MSILDKAQAGQGFLERIANKVPGFKGYRDQELRRDADRIEREHLAAELEACKKPLDELANAATRSGSLDVINDIETARKRLDRLIAQIRHADRGYSGFFDAIKVDEALLERVYQFDLGLIADVQAVRGAAAAAGDPKAAVSGMIAAIDALSTRLSDREHILSGIQ